MNTEIGVELLELAQHHHPLLRRQQLELALVPETAELVETLDSLGDRAPVRQQPAEPAVVHVRHAYPLGLGFDGVLGLLLRADEEHRPTAAGEIAGEVVCALERVERLAQVDDVDAAARSVQEAAHLGVPAARLVAEVHPGLQQLAHRHHGHCGFLLFGCVQRRTGLEWNRLQSRHRHPGGPPGRLRKRRILAV
jgi:hypothetical protein